jgi:hypothetical protein
MSNPHPHIRQRVVTVDNRELTRHVRNLERQLNMKTLFSHKEIIAAGKLGPGTYRKRMSSVEDPQ